MDFVKRHRKTFAAFAVFGIWAAALLYAQNRIAPGPYGVLFRTSTETGVTTVTLSTTEFAPGLLILNPGTTATTYTTPTASNICSAFPGVAIAAPGTSSNWGYTLAMRNIGGSGGTATIAAGSGVTLATGNTNSVAVSHTRNFIVVPTACNGGNNSGATAAVTVYSAQDSAH